MTFTLLAARVVTKHVKLTDNTATTIPIGLGQPFTVVGIECTEIGSDTPNLTIEVYDPAGPTSYYKKFEEPMQAKETVSYTVPFVVPNQWELRITSSNASGEVDVSVTYIPPDANSNRPVV